MCDWIMQNLGADVPLHFTAFHPDFRLQNRGPTPPETLIRARRQALAAGLKYVYTGNMFDAQTQSTYCPHCNTCVIERDWFKLGAYHIRDNNCAFCGQKVHGVFEKDKGNWGPRRVPVSFKHA
jgi:pyruvate formate lyase activating enzyme